MNNPDVIVGIDLGTTNSEVVALVDGQPQVLAFEGRQMLPSCVGIAPDGALLIGEEARNQALVYPECTVRSVKRKMGRDERFELGDKSFTPPEISALILRELIRWAQKALEAPVCKAVITVPAYFSDAQRQATRQAGELAGLEVMRILNEPTAASLAYGTDAQQQTVLVYDLGGGTFDVSVVSMEDDVTEVLASHGNNQLGGDDFDQLLLEDLLAEFEKQHGLNLEDQHPAAYARLRWAAEQAKIKLSSEPDVRVYEEALVVVKGKPLHLDMMVTREGYEEKIHPLLSSTLESVHQALGDAGKQPEDLDVILLVGGSTRTPLVRTMLEEAMHVPVRQDVHPDLCVALGAGLMGARLAGHDIDRVLVDVSPYSFGPSHLGMRDGQLYPHCYHPIIKRNTPLPVSCTERYYTSMPHQTEVAIDIFQGDEPDAMKNLLVGSFRVEGLTSVAEENEVLCRMNLDLDGILRVEAIEKRTGLSKHITIKDAIKEKSVEEQAQARKRLQNLYQDRLDPQQDFMEAAFEESVAVAEGADIAEVDPKLAPLVSDARVLMERSRQQLAQVHDEDKEELIDLHEKIEEAITEQDETSLRDAMTQLKELLFFIEGH